MSVNIKYKNNSIATLTDTGTKTLKTSGKYCEADIIVENTKDGGGGGNKVETFSITPAEDVRKQVLEIGNTSIITPHFCCCFTNTKLGNNASDSTNYEEIMTYVGGDNHYFGNIWTGYYNGETGAVVYIKGASYGTYNVSAYGAGLGFNKKTNNGFYVKDGKLYSDTTHGSTEYTFIAGVTYYVILVGD